jgi:Fe(3+) dicitrate transport protein
MIAPRSIARSLIAVAGCAGLPAAATVAVAEPAVGEMSEPSALAGPPSSAPADPEAPPPRVTSPSSPAPLATRWVIAGQAAATAPVIAADELPVVVDEAADAELLATVGSEVIEIVDEPPGAHAVIDTVSLERAESDNVHRILEQVPGVYVRDEDGYGLRPNIGMRGAAAERSAKIALMEDGILIAPAPYSAPAAYYFPLSTRMSAIEVTKGPSAIVYGPNTVGGAVNMISAPIASERSGYLDVGFGSDLYGKLHGRAAEGGERWGVMAEYVRLRTDGFKELDDGGDTGFAKNDVQLSARLTSAPTARVYHRVEARVGYSDEGSDETYTGLTDADFAASPQRRYVATRYDHMEWDHWRLRLSHTLELGSWLSVETTAYRNQLDRAWAKVDGFVGQRDFAGLLANPMVGTNAIYYRVLTGETDGASDQEELIRGTNDRQFVSQGVQARAKIRRAIGPTSHEVDAGVRVHYDLARRKRFEDFFQMVQRRLVPSTRVQQIPVDSTAETLAIALHVQDSVRWNRLQVVAGTRLEIIDIGFESHLAPDMPSVDDAYTVLIPGGGAEYDVTDELTVLAGVHRGFVPSTPSQDFDNRPELSVNYEAGARWRSSLASADLIGFFSDYSNLKGFCSQSTGCRAEQDGQDFDGGRVHVYGLEAQATSAPEVAAGIRLPLRASYTLTQSEFQSSFTADFAGWGEVVAGDEQPYVPAHQVALGAGVRTSSWELGAGTLWRGAMRDLAGHGDIPDGERIDDLLTVHVNGHVKLGRWGEIYGTCDNVLDEQKIVSRRPYGARPNAPRLFTLGYKARF